MMIKKIGILFLAAFVFSGAWWDKKPAPANTPPAVAEKSEEPRPETAVKPAETQNPEAVNPKTSNSGALKMFTEGDAETRKARLESLVRLSNALRKQRQLNEPGEG